MGEIAKRKKSVTTCPGLPYVDKKVQTLKFKRLQIHKRCTPKYTIKSFIFRSLLQQIKELSIT